ncbi:tyrosine-protein phosphatase non-receptor type 2 isoform X1 [Ixodes scapularis]|uniref:tyrosine-protein phosphatase non-receptor type 2 isoform X1 n=1 Tax=Ixodes scapularis TaxID=6945 RepID=UPI001A9CEA8D|nr:tyrosine-protein phosphatase non-receptor type 2 isoform X1 [Ixodes scapularis]
MEQEFEEIDSKNSWNSVYQKIRHKSSNYDYAFKDARRPDNRNLNRYRDVNPYDHSRVVLRRGDKDYINASLVEVKAAKRSYILTQGPLQSTTSHFWLMVWEQKTKAILMLNRIIEKNTVKCHQYWPVGDEELVLPSVGLKVTFLSEKPATNYTVRELLLTDLQGGESRVVQQLHYTTWPDFGVPESPASFLAFLRDVRATGALDGAGPPVVHCSAGIGRSGTFCLVDSCLVLIEAAGGRLDAVDVPSVLLEMRRFRMGLIQTPDQLRFSYLAILEGARALARSDRPEAGARPAAPRLAEQNGLGEDASSTSEASDSSDDEDEGDEDRDPPEVPPAPPLPPRLLKRPSVETPPCKSEDWELRQRQRRERLKRTAQTVQRMRQKQRSSEAWQQRRRLLQRLSLGAALVLGVGLLAYKSLSSSQPPS